MRQNVIHIERFYASPLGKTARAMVNRRLDPLWPKADGDMKGLDVLGFGYCAPYLMRYREQAGSLIFAMPEDQGAMISRSKRGNITCLVEDERLPFATASFDRVFVAHGLEDTQRPARLMDELWRVLRPEGQIVILAANRAGLWSRSDASPFGSGRPFTRGQLGAVLTGAQFLPTAWASALYMPPSRRLTGIAGGLERFGETVMPRFSGLILVRAIKRLYANTQSGHTAKMRVPDLIPASPAKTAQTGKTGS